MRGRKYVRTVVRTDDFVQFFCTHGAPLRAKNSAMTKPRYSENILKNDDYPNLNYAGLLSFLV